MTVDAFLIAPQFSNHVTPTTNAFKKKKQWCHQGKSITFKCQKLQLNIQLKLLKKQNKIKDSYVSNKTVIKLNMLIDKK